MPIGVNAKLSGESLTIHAILGLPNGEKILRESLHSVIASPYEAKQSKQNANDSCESNADLGIQNAKTLAQKLFAICEQKGAKPLLDEALAMIEDYFG